MQKNALALKAPDCTAESRMDPCPADTTWIMWHLIQKPLRTEEPVYPAGENAAVDCTIPLLLVAVQAPSSGG